MSRSIVQNSYTDEFKKNTVAMIKAGWPLKTTARRLGISVNTIRYWVSQDRFKDIQPASGETIKALSTEIAAVSNYQKPSLVQLTKKENEAKRESNAMVKVCYGKLSVEFSNGLEVEDLKAIIQALGGRDVL